MILPKPFSAFLILLTLSLAFANENLFASVIHNEAAMGDLSGVSTAPTDLTSQFIVPGTNTIQGQLGSDPDNNNPAIGTGATNTVNDADYFSITLAAGQSITSITLDSYTSGGIASTDVFFAAYVNDSGFAGQTGADIDAGDLFAAPGDITFDLTGQTTLGPGTHSFWLQQTSGGEFDYSISFNVASTSAAVPEPSSLGALALLGGMCLGRRRRRS